MHMQDAPHHTNMRHPPLPPFPSWQPPFLGHHLPSVCRSRCPPLSRGSRSTTVAPCTRWSSAKSTAAPSRCYTPEPPSSFAPPCNLGLTCPALLLPRHGPRNIALRARPLTRYHSCRFCATDGTFCLRRIAHGQPVHIVCARDVPEAVFMAELGSAFRGRGFNVDVIAAHAAAKDGSAMDRVSCVKRLVKHVITFMHTLAPPSPTPNDLQSKRILELEEPLAAARQLPKAEEGKLATHNNPPSSASGTPQLTVAAMLQGNFNSSTSPPPAPTPSVQLNAPTTSSESTWVIKSYNGTNKLGSSKSTSGPRGSMSRTLPGCTPMLCYGASPPRAWARCRLPLLTNSLLSPTCSVTDLSRCEPHAVSPALRPQLHYVYFIHSSTSYQRIFASHLWVQTRLVASGIHTLFRPRCLRLIDLFHRLTIFPLLSFLLPTLCI